VSGDALLNVLVGVALAVSAVGILLPILPGTLLAAGALLVWAVVSGGPMAWSVLAITVVLLGLGQVLKYLLPHKSMTAAGVPGRTIVVGWIAGIAGFILVPIVGLPVGFVAGVLLAEVFRLGRWQEAWESTWVAMRATGFAMLIELAALLLAASIWFVAVLTASLG
jgi:uncharacterized protein YqgC (DUF456 family)